LYVVKTDGLAAGKGVVVTDSLMDAREAVRSYLSGEAFGDAGRTLVIEEGLTGPELSLLVVCNGHPDDARPLAPAQDFKRIGDDDRGLNTGGMGAYSPVPIVSNHTVDDVMTRAVRPTLHWLAQQGIDYRGVLYAGMMLTPDGPKVIEYNVRFGDPECQAVLPRFTGDLAELLRSAAAGEPDLAVEFSEDVCVTVVLAADGYPAEPRTGDVITGLDAARNTDGVVVFHAGTARREDGTLVTAGGRVLDVTATGPTIIDARARAYGAVGRIGWAGMQFRRDIAEAGGRAAAISGSGA
jgi:phosphoribosylamine--glycine ligase